MNYALIGCGRIARTHIAAALATGMEIVALCDISEQAIEELIAECGLEGRNIATYRSYRALLAEQKLDVVAITTESLMHYEIARACLEQGIPTLVEKPMALDLGQADAMVEAARKGHVQLCVCQQNRFNVASRLVHRAIERNAFGTISHGSVTVRWSRDKAYYDQGSWRGTWDHDGGALMNQSIHGFDLLRWFFGSKIVQVEGHLANRNHPYLEVEDLGFAFVTFANGIVATMEGTTNTWKKDLGETITIIGKKGMVRLTGEAAEHIDVWDFEDPEVASWAADSTTQHFSSVYGTSHQALYDDMIHAIAEHRAPLVDGRCGRDALELVLAVYKSHKEGKPVDLPLEGFSTKAMKGCFDNCPT